MEFGSIEEGGKPFCPGLRIAAGEFDGCVRAGQTVRYGLEIMSDYFTSPRPQVFEVSWDGQWSDDLDRMSQHLQIREVAPEDRPAAAPPARPGRRRDTQMRLPD